MGAALWQVLDLSSAEVKEEFIHGRGFSDVVMGWVEAADNGVPNSIRVASKALATIQKLPMDVKALQQSGAGR